MKQSKIKPSTIEPEVENEWQNLQNAITFTDPTLDNEFKRLFATPGNEDLLQTLIDSIIPEKGITSVTLGNQENHREHANSKKTIFDVRCTTQDGTTVIVEMQVSDNADFTDRMMFYSSYPIQEQVMKGEKQYTLTPIIMIAITKFCIQGGATTPNAINRFCFMNKEDSGRCYSDKLELVTLELPKFLKDRTMLTDDRERFIWLFKNMHHLKEVPPEFQTKKFEKLLRIANFASMTYEQQIEYTRNYLAELDRNSELKTAINKGLEQGLEKGRAEGLSQGILEGKRAMVTALKEQGVPIETIAVCSGLSLDEIKAL